MFWCAIFYIVSVSFVCSTRAVVLDWSSVTWTPGSLSNSYDVDPASPGNDITVTVSGDTSFLQPDYNPPNPMTPAITTTLAGGFSPAPQSLVLAADFTTQLQALRVTVNFSAAYTQGSTVSRL